MNNVFRLRVKLIFYVAAIFSAVMVVSFLLKGNAAYSPKHWMITLPATRGKLLDVNDRLCAVDEAFYVAYLDVNYLKQRYIDSIDAQLSLLVKNFNLPYSPAELLNGKTRFIRLDESRDREAIVNKIPTSLLPFISIEIQTRRRQISDYALDKIVGRVIDGHGTGGVEEKLDKILKKRKDGKLLLKYHGFVSLSPNIEQIIEPEDGSDVKLSIDIDIQKICYEEIQKAVLENNAIAGGVVVMETNTGKIRAMVTTRDWNDAVLGYFEPGSAIKPVIYSIAIENNIVGPDDVFECNGSVKPVEDLDIVVKDLEAHGQVDVQKALAVSCNTATILIAKKIKEKMGEYGYYSWLRRFGLGEKTGVEIAGEIDGVLRKPEQWSKIDFAMISIGHGVGTPPLQFLAAFNVIANRGEYVYPTLLEEKIPETRRIVSEKTSSLVCQMLRKVVEEGTGIKAQVPGVNVAGKTGTAQKIAAGEGKYFSIFAGFYPYENPKYTILVYIDEPSNERYLASEVAAPVFASIVRKIIDLSRERWISFPKGIMPNLKGLSLRDALIIMNELGVKNVRFNGTGLVADQYPEAGSSDLREVVLILEEP